MTRRPRLLVVCATTVALSATFVAPAQAAVLTITMPITGTATLAKTGSTLTIPAGAQLTGTIVDGKVVGSLTIPPMTAHVRVFDVPKWGDTTSTVRIVETEPATAEFSPTGTVVATAKVRIELPRVTSDVAPWFNIVQPTCRTKPFTVSLTGTVQLATAFPMTGTFEIPSFERCGFSVFGAPSPRDLLLTSMLSGPGNSMNVLAGPATITTS